MAYVVARPRGRFEIRESIHTEKGPRARTLANFEELTDTVLENARRRAHRPFDADAVRVSAARARETAVRRRAGLKPLGGVAAPLRPEMRRFAASSRRMAATVDERPSPAASRPDPGDALIDLLDLTARISAFTSPRTPEPLQFPPLARLRADRMARASN